jgi:hypothetical protein
MEQKIKDLYWLIGKTSHLSIDNKLLMYKTVIKPIWTYGILLWGCLSKSNIDLMQRTQSKIVRLIVNAPWYVSNQTLHIDLKSPYVTGVIKEYSINLFRKLENHPNPQPRPPYINLTTEELDVNGQKTLQIEGNIVGCRPTQAK